MSEQVIDNDTCRDEAPNRGLVCRSFAAEITAGDGRTVDVRIIPFGERIKHNDGLGGAPRGVVYEEEWMPGVFRHQLKAADKVLGNYEHMEGPAGLVARATSLREERDGYHATFRMLNGPDADKTLELIREGVLDGVSVEARPVKNIRSASGVIQRVRADLKQVAFTRFAAFSGARVLAVREEDIEPSFIDEELLPLEIDQARIQRWRAAGITLPDRYQAHTAENGHPDTIGTPEDGTRQHMAPTSSEVSDHVPDPH